MNLKKLPVYTKYEVHSNPLSLFRQFDFFHTLCVLFESSDSRGGVLDQYLGIGEPLRV